MPIEPNRLVSIRDAAAITFFSGVRSVMQWCKKTLIGDLELPLTLNFKIYKENIKTQLSQLNGLQFGGILADKTDKEVVVKQFGLLGWLSPWPLNVAVVRPQANSNPELMRSLLEKVDSEKDSRPVLEPFSHLTGHPHFIALGGEKGLHGHKVFARSLPSRNSAYRITISETKEAIRKGFAKGEEVNDPFLKGIVRNILVQLMLGCRLTPSIDKLLNEMESILLHHHKLDSRIKQDYAKLLQEIIHDRLLDEGSCMLSNMLKEKFPQGLDKEEKQRKAMADHDIAVLPTMLVVAFNVTRLLSVVLRNIRHADLAILLTEMQEKSVSVSDEFCAEIDEKIIKLSVLDNIFKEGLRMGGFDPTILYRYTSKAIKIEKTKIDEETTIPAKSWIAIHHRAPVSWQENFDLHRHEQPDAPQLNTQSFAPFSLGVRRCAGQRLAEDIAKGIFTVMAESLHENFWTKPYYGGRSIELRNGVLSDNHSNGSVLGFC